MRTHNLLKASGFTLMELLVCVGLVALLTGVWSIKHLRSHSAVSDTLCERQLSDLNKAVDAFRIEYPEENVLIGDSSPIHTQQVLQTLWAKKLISFLPNPLPQSAGSGDNFYFQRLGNITLQRTSQQDVPFTPWSSCSPKQDSPVGESNRKSSPTLSKKETLCKISNTVLDKTEQDLR